VLGRGPAPATPTSTKGLRWASYDFNHPLTLLGHMLTNSEPKAQ
jgi:hypothetical protein